MVKKILLYSLLAAAIGLIAYVYYEFSKEESAAVDPYSAVPDNVGVVWEFKTGTALQQYLPWIHEISSEKNELANIPFNPAAHWFHAISTLDSLRVHNSLWNQVLMNSSVVLASTAQMRGDNWMMSIGITEAVSETQLMSQWFQHNEKRSFKNTTIYKGSSLQYARVNHCLVIATSNATMEDVILRTEKQNLLTKELHFATARDARSKDVPLHFYFPIEDGQWIQLDPAYHHEKLSIHGYAILNESSKSHITLSGEGAGFEIASVLPSNTIFLDAFSYKSFEDGWNKCEQYYQKTDAGKFWGQAWKDYGDSCACDLNELLLSWRGNEWGTAVIPMSDSTTAKLMYISVRDSLDAIAIMSRLLKPEEGNIHRLMMPQLMDRNKPQSIYIENNFVTQLGQFIFFAASAAELKVLHKSIAGEKQSRNQLSRAIHQVNKEAGRFTYQAGQSAAIIPTVITNVFSGSQFVALSVQPYTSNKYLVQLTLPNTTSSLAENSTSPATHLEPISEELDMTDALSWSVINHNDKSNETLMQLANGQLCLLDKNQNVLWQRTIDGRVMGEVTQVDALKNGKLQYAFTTNKALYIIDRTGKDLKGFPVKMKSTILSPLHVADYDKDKKYRLLFATEDGRMHNYSIEGQTTTGWKSPAIAACYISSFKIGTEDFLFTAEKNGKIQLLKRTGETKVKTSTVLDNYDGHKCIISTGSDIYESTVTYTDVSGTVKTAPIAK